VGWASCIEAYSVGLPVGPPVAGPFASCVGVCVTDASGAHIAVAVALVCVEERFSTILRCSTVVASGVGCGVVLSTSVFGGLCNAHAMGARLKKLQSRPPLLLLCDLPQPSR
jgi:hypothetical protein